jgi:hypothetical protein
MNTCHRQARVPSARSPPKSAKLKVATVHLLEHGKGVLMDPVRRLLTDTKARNPPLAATHGRCPCYAS